MERDPLTFVTFTSRLSDVSARLISVAGTLTAGSSQATTSYGNMAQAPLSNGTVGSFAASNTSLASKLKNSVVGQLTSGAQHRQQAMGVCERCVADCRTLYHDVEDAIVTECGGATSLTASVSCVPAWHAAHRLLGLVCMEQGRALRLLRRGVTEANALRLAAAHFFVFEANAVKSATSASGDALLLACECIQTACRALVDDAVLSYGATGAADVTFQRLWVRAAAFANRLSLRGAEACAQLCCAPPPPALIVLPASYLDPTTGPLDVSQRPWLHTLPSRQRWAGAFLSASAAGGLQETDGAVASGGSADAAAFVVTSGTTYLGAIPHNFRHSVWVSEVLRHTADWMDAFACREVAADYLDLAGEFLCCPMILEIGPGRACADADLQRGAVREETKPSLETPPVATAAAGSSVPPPQRSFTDRLKSRLDSFSLPGRGNKAATTTAVQQPTSTATDKGAAKDATVPTQVPISSTTNGIPDGTGLINGRRMDVPVTELRLLSNVMLVSLRAAGVHGSLKHYVTAESVIVRAMHVFVNTLAASDAEDSCFAARPFAGGDADVVPTVATLLEDEKQMYFGHVMRSRRMWRQPALPVMTLLFMHTVRRGLLLPRRAPPAAASDVSTDDAPPIVGDDAAAILCHLPSALFPSLAASIAPVFDPRSAIMCHTLMCMNILRVACLMLSRRVRCCPFSIDERGSSSALDTSSSSITSSSASRPRVSEASNTGEGSLHLVQLDADQMEYVRLINAIYGFHVEAKRLIQYECSQLRQRDGGELPSRGCQTQPPNSDCSTRADVRADVADTAGRRALLAAQCLWTIQRVGYEVLVPPHPSDTPSPLSHPILHSLKMLYETVDETVRANEPPIVALESDAVFHERLTKVGDREGTDEDDCSGVFSRLADLESTDKRRMWLCRSALRELCGLVGDTAYSIADDPPSTVQQTHPIWKDGAVLPSAVVSGGCCDAAETDIQGVLHRLLIRCFGGVDVA